MKKRKTMKHRLRAAAIAALCLLTVSMSFTGCGDKDKSQSSSTAESSTEAAAPAEAEETTAEAAQPTEESSQEEPEIDGNAMLSQWTDSAEAKKQLISYMKSITDIDSSDYIPVEDRIAVFDFDGTLFCETDTNYFD